MKLRCLKFLNSRMRDSISSWIVRTMHACAIAMIVMLSMHYDVVKHRRQAESALIEAQYWKMLAHHADSTNALHQMEFVSTTRFLRGSKRLLWMVSRRDDGSFEWSCVDSFTRCNRHSGEYTFSSLHDSSAIVKMSFGPGQNFFTADPQILKHK